MRGPGRNEKKINFGKKLVNLLIHTGGFYLLREFPYIDDAVTCIKSPNAHQCTFASTQQVNGCNFEVTPHPTIIYLFKVNN